MSDQLEQIGGIPVFVCAADGTPVAAERDAVDLVGALAGQDAQWLAIPVGRLTGGFFRLSTGIAGAIVGKLVGYRIRVAIVGDISAYTAESGPLRDWVRESNRGSDVWFVSDLAELGERFGRTAQSMP